MDKLAELLSYCPRGILIAPPENGGSILLKGASSLDDFVVFYEDLEKGIEVALDYFRRLDERHSL